MSKRKVYREPTKAELHKMYGGQNGEQFTLNELLTPNWGGDTSIDHLAKMILTARWRITDAFGEVRILQRGKLRYTDNYVVLAREELEGLLQYMQSQIRTRFVLPHHLAVKWQDVSPRDQKTLCIIAEEQLLLAALKSMDDNKELWYDHGHGLWSITPSCAEEAGLARKDAQRSLRGVKKFYDSRTYHGRNGKQARRRDKQTGNAYRSTGFANQVR